MSNHPMFLYSVNSRLAYNINKKYYGKHYVWCATEFNAKNSFTRNSPPTSTPSEIIAMFYRDKNGCENDSHYRPSFIRERLNGINRGINKMSKYLSKDKIDGAKKLLKAAKREKRFEDIAPLLYIIPIDLVKDKMKAVPVEDRARIYSEEYIIEDLTDDEFEVIEIKMEV